MEKSPRIAVILAGCGHKDGAEIREAVLALLYLDKQGAQVECFAPDVAQRDVINHAKGEVASGEIRNVLVEAARIARGNIRALSQLNETEFDGLVLPGGFGVAKNLSSLAFEGPDCTVLPEYERVIRAFHAAKKPVGAICIAPAVLVAALRGTGAEPQVTIGDDAATAGAIQAMGGKHQNSPTERCVIDAQNRIVSCPAYMSEARLSAVAEGIERLVSEVLVMANHSQRSAA